MNPTTIAIIGGGPAGLRAAEVASAAGARVELYDASRSVGRKFLVAGKSGLNLTNSEEFEGFLARYRGHNLPDQLWRKILGGFDNRALQAWAAELGVETCAAPGGKVFPVSMKAAPLLRAWVRRLRSLGVAFHVNHRLEDLASGHPLHLSFETAEGTRQTVCSAIVLALGGGSWPQTGSTGSWQEILRKHSIEVVPLRAANCGWEVDWPAGVLDEAEGKPLKNIALHAGSQSAWGELVLTRYGLEGSPIYHLGPILREMDRPSVTLDLKPSLTLEEVTGRLARVSSNYVREARRRLKLGKAAASLLRHLPHLGPWDSPANIAAAIKACQIPLVRPRPLAEAISTAGGVAWSELDENLMLRNLPGVFVSGEMIDWEAPTGGYLLQACFATGGHAGEAAAGWTQSLE